MKEPAALAAFASAHEALLAKEALAAAGLPFYVMPLPGSIRAGCGIALRFDLHLLPLVRKALAGRFDKDISFYQIEGGAFLPLGR